MTRWEQIQNELRARPRRWLVTGAAGFIGSHLVEGLLGLGQEVVGLDDLSTGSLANLADIRTTVGEENGLRFRFDEGDIRDLEACREACEGVSLVLHQAALGSVPRSIEDPLTSHAVNVSGFVNVLQAAREAGCERLVYASSSSVYGDHPGLPKHETEIGNPLSPYAGTKFIDEVYAEVFARSYGMSLAGLRYFNVFGPRQDPNGPYAAVIPKWIEIFSRGETPRIYGDGETSRDFCPVENVVQANVLAACSAPGAGSRVYNVALGGRTTLGELFVLIRDSLARHGADCADVQPVYEDFREGDVRHSLADTTLAHDELGYEPEVDLTTGMESTTSWFLRRQQGLRAT